MLTYMRKHSKSWIIKFIFFAIIIVFVAWGGSSYWAREESKVAKIDSHIISIQQYSKAYTDTVSAYQQQYGQVFNAEMIKMLNLKERVLDQMINNYIMEQEAKRFGIGITDDELQEAIREVPTFVSGGTFDLEKYKRILSYYRLTPQEFENQQRREMIRQRLYAVLTDNVFVTKDEIEASYRGREDTFDLNFITISLSPEQFTKDVAPNENEILAWYEAHKEAYKQPPKTKIAYVLFDGVRYMSKVDVPMAEVQDYYEAHKREYTIPARVHARHILIVVPGDADEKVNKAKEQDARQILEQAQAHADFAALAKKYSQDPGSAQHGGDLGFVEKDKLADGIGDILFSLKPGEIKGPVRTRYGFHILKLEEKQDSKEKPFEEVSEAIKLTLKEREAKDLAYDEANKAFSAIYEHPQMDIAGYAKSHGLALIEFGPFAELEQIDLPMGSKVAKDAFSRPEGDLGDLVDTGSGYMLYKVMSRIPARIPELKEVRDKVVADVTRSKLMEAAKARAKEIAAQSPEKLLTQNPESTGVFKRSTLAIPKLGMDSQIRKDLDNLKKPKVFTEQGKVYVVWLKQFQKADVASLKEEQSKSIREELIRQKKDMIFDTFLKQAKARHDIVIDRNKLL